MKSSQRALTWHLNREGLSNEIIEDFATHANIDAHFAGVYHMHELPSHLPRSRAEFSIIINIDNHWTTLYWSNTYILYIDSFGEGMPSAVEVYVKKFCEPHQAILFNNHPIQDKTSTHCGLFSMLFILFFDRKAKASDPYIFNNVVHLRFSECNLLLNDQLCLKYIECLLYT